MAWQRSLLLLVPACAAATLSLCACTPLNSDLSMGEGITLEAVAPDRTPRPFAPIEPGQSDKVSLKPASMDRSHWGIRRVTVPVSGVEHRPIYATGPGYADETARQRGEYPSIYSALDLGGAESAWDQVFEGLAWPFWAGLDVALLPARAIVQPPWSVQRSPLERHERAPIGTASPAMLGDPEPTAVPGVDATPTVPPTSRARWIWRDGKWYYWRPGDPEPWFVAPAEPAPSSDQPAPPRRPWRFKDGKWVRDEN